MKLATLKNQTRDGALCVVTKNLKQAEVVSDIAPTLQAALDDWDYFEPRLQDRYEQLNRDSGPRAFAVDFARFHSPLPRAYQWFHASAYQNHVELVRKAHPAEMPKESHHDPLLIQGGSDNFVGPHDPIEVESEDWGIDFGGAVAVITDDVPMGVKPDRAGNHIRLLTLVNDVSLRNLMNGELSKGFGFFHAKPSCAFAPVAVTPDELGDAWDGKRLHLPLMIHLNGKLFGKPNAGVEMTFHFARLLAYATKTRRLAAGTILGSGTVSNKDQTVGAACLAEQRVIETREHSAPRTPFLRFGDRVKIEMIDAAAQSIFGTIDQTVVAYSGTQRARERELPRST